MRILLSTFGSRGDVEPLAALGAALQAEGAEAVVCAPPDPEFAALLERAGVPLAPAFTAVRQWVADALANRPPASLPERAAVVMAGQFKALSAAAEGCDAVLATGLFPSAAAARCVADVQGLPYVFATYCPIWLPSEHHRPSPFPGHPVPAEITDNRLLWDQNIGTKNALFGAPYAALRASLGLPQVDNIRDHVFTDQPWLASDAVLSPWAPTDLGQVVQTGAWILTDDRPLSAELEAFLAAGPPPVYVGFGSMPMEALKAAALAAIEAVRAQGRRVVLAHGWAGLALADAGADCFATGDVSQQALFGRVAAVVHHGGAGTTTTAARAGAPQLIVPQIGDQPWWARRVGELGVGAPHEGPAPTVESLSAALSVVLAPETAARARAAAGTIRSDGAAVAAKLLLTSLCASACSPNEVRFV